MGLAAGYTPLFQGRALQTVSIAQLPHQQNGGENLKPAGVMDRDQETGKSCVWQCNPSIWEAKAGGSSQV